MVSFVRIIGDAIEHVSVLLVDAADDGDLFGKAAKLRHAGNINAAHIVACTHLAHLLLFVGLVLLQEVVKCGWLAGAQHIIAICVVVQFDIFFKEGVEHIF